MKWKFILFIITAICFFQIVSGQDSSRKADKLLTITGKVTTGDLKPVEGAEFYIDNIRTNYKTKSNGTYKIKVSPSALKLEARSSEYGSCETLINEQTNINFTLKKVPEEESLNATDTLKDKAVTNPGNKPVKTKAKKMNTYTDIYQMIRSEVSGVVVSGRSIQIQQGHSFFGSSDPLLVVNGVIVNSIDNINPLEVKSITVLKGSSAAIYGVRGSNGVISITLINGSEKNK
jgi:TonB-dependent starch-binding outer membrane protein SusC